MRTVLYSRDSSWECMWCNCCFSGELMVGNWSVAYPDVSLCINPWWRVSVHAYMQNNMWLFWIFFLCCIRVKICCPTCTRTPNCLFRSDVLPASNQHKIWYLSCCWVLSILLDWEWADENNALKAVLWRKCGRQGESAEIWLPLITKAFPPQPLPAQEQSSLNSQQRLSPALRGNVEPVVWSSGCFYCRRVNVVVSLTLYSDQFYSRGLSNALPLQCVPLYRYTQNILSY